MSHLRLTLNLAPVILIGNSFTVMHNTSKTKIRLSTSVAMFYWVCTSLLTLCAFSPLPSKGVAILDIQVLMTMGSEVTHLCPDLSRDPWPPPPLSLVWMDFLTLTCLDGPLSCVPTLLYVYKLELHPQMDMHQSPCIYSLTVHGSGSLLSSFSPRLHFSHWVFGLILCQEGVLRMEGARDINPFPSSIVYFLLLFVCISIFYVIYQLWSSLSLPCTCNVFYK